MLNIIVSNVVFFLSVQNPWLYFIYDVDLCHASLLVYSQLSYNFMVLQDFANFVVFLPWRLLGILHQGYL